MKFFSLIFTFIIVSLTIAQKDSINKIPTFKLVAVNFNFFPKDNHLFICTENKIKIIVKPKIAFNCGVSNGIIKKINDSIYTINNTLPVNTLLSIYTKDARGKEHLVVTKEYKFSNFPVVKLAKVKSDSAINKMMLAVGSFYVEVKKQVFPVVAFKMELIENDQVILDSTVGCRLSKKMLKYTSTQKPGSILYFSDIKYRLPDGRILVEPMYRVFIIPEDPNPERFNF